MSYRPFVLAAATAALSSMHVASAAAQPAYVAPGGIYVGGGPARVYGPAYGYGYGRGAYEAPGYDDGYGVSAHEGYGDECEPGPYGAPGYDHGYGPAPRYGRPARTAARSNFDNFSQCRTFAMTLHAMI